MSAVPSYISINNTPLQNLALIAGKSLLTKEFVDLDKQYSPLANKSMYAFLATVATVAIAIIFGPAKIAAAAIVPLAVCFHYASQAAPLQEKMQKEMNGTITTIYLRVAAWLKDLQRKREDELLNCVNDAVNKHSFVPNMKDAGVRILHQTVNGQHKAYQDTLSQAQTVYQQQNHHYHQWLTKVISYKIVRKSSDSSPTSTPPFWEFNAWEYLKCIAETFVHPHAIQRSPYAYINLDTESGYGSRWPTNVSPIYRHAFHSLLARPDKVQSDA